MIFYRYRLIKTPLTIKNTKTSIVAILILLLLNIMAFSFFLKPWCCFKNIKRQNVKKVHKTDSQMCNSTINELDHRYCKCPRTLESWSERYLELSSENPPPKRLGQYNKFIFKRPFLKKLEFLYLFNNKIIRRIFVIIFYEVVLGQYEVSYDEVQPYYCLVPSVLHKGILTRSQRLVLNKWLWCGLWTSGDQWCCLLSKICIGLDCMSIADLKGGQNTTLVLWVTQVRIVVLPKQQGNDFN